MPPDPSVHVGVCAIVHASLDATDVLMVKRGGTGPFASDGFGTWAVPGGWLERGEEPCAAAERETFEETGVVASAQQELGFVCCPSEAAPLQIVTLFILCRYEGGTPTVTEPDKCPEVRFMPLLELDHLPLFTPVVAWRAKGGLRAAPVGRMVQRRIMREHYEPVPIPEGYVACPHCGGKGNLTAYERGYRSLVHDPKGDVLEACFGCFGAGFVRVRDASR